MVDREHASSNLLHCTGRGFVKCSSGKQHGVDRPHNCPRSKEQQDLSVPLGEYSKIREDVISSVIKESAMINAYPLTMNQSLQKRNSMPNKPIEMAPCVVSDEVEAIVGVKDFLSSNRMKTLKESHSPATRVSAPCAEVLKLIVESVRDYAIFAQDTNGSILSWNQGVTAILGYNEEEFVGNMYQSFSLLKTSRTARSMIRCARRKSKVGL